MSKMLRFYLRGLGIGVIVTALILSIVNLNSSKQGGLTDAEVVARAKQLGMVEGNSYSLSDAAADKNNTGASGENTTPENGNSTTPENGNGTTPENGNDVKPSEGEVKPEDGTAPDGGEVKPEDGTAPDGGEVKPEDGTAPDGGEVKPEDGTAPDGGEVRPEDGTAPDGGEVKPEDGTTIGGGDAAGSEQSGTVSITIKSGYGSEKVAAALVTAGVVDNAKDFNSYMEKNGYSRRIHVGTFEIPLNATYEEICKIIAK